MYCRFEFHLRPHHHNLLIKNSKTTQFLLLLRVRLLWFQYSTRSVRKYLLKTLDKRQNSGKIQNVGKLRITSLAFRSHHARSVGDSARSPSIRRPPSSAWRTSSSTPSCPRHERPVEQRVPQPSARASSDARTRRALRVCATPSTRGDRWRSRRTP